MTLPIKYMDDDDMLSKIGFLGHFLECPIKREIRAGDYQEPRASNFLLCHARYVDHPIRWPHFHSILFNKTGRSSMDVR